MKDELYKKVITVYDVRKALYLNYAVKPVKQVLNTIVNYSDMSHSFLINEATRYVTDLELVIDEFGIETLGQLLPYSDVIYMESYYHTLNSSFHQFHYDNVLAIRRFAKQYDDNYVFGRVEGQGSIFDHYVGKVLMASMPDFTMSVMYHPLRVVTGKTFCICELIEYLMGDNGLGSFILARDIIQMIDELKLTVNPQTD